MALANTAAALKAEQDAAMAWSSDAVRQEIEHWLDAVRERLTAAEAAMPKCPRCGQALPHGVQIDEEDPKPAGSGEH